MREPLRHDSFMLALSGTLGNWYISQVSSMTTCMPIVCQSAKVASSSFVVPLT